MGRQRLFEAVDRGDMTLAELARRLEVSRSYLCNVRKGRRRVSRSMEIRAAHLLGIPRAELRDEGQPEVRAGSGPSPPRSPP